MNTRTRLVTIVLTLAICALAYWGYNNVAWPARSLVAVGDIYTVELEENPSTGYAWAVEYDQNKLQLVKDEAGTPSTPMPGAPNKHIWQFRAIARGLARIKFSYARPWESQPPEQVVTYTIRIK